jgi:hypothetical protein
MNLIVFETLRNVAYYSIKDDVEQSRKLELAASDDLLLDNA